jgi:hypothetical protein
MGSASSAYLEGIMRSSTVFALLLLVLVAVGHVVRILFGIEVSIGGDNVPVWWSVPAAILFAVAAALLWRDNRVPAAKSD